MSHAYQERIAEATTIQRKIAQGDARICRAPFGAAWKALFPHKAAENLACRTGCSIRSAAYELSGEHEPSGRSIAVLINEITKRGE